MKKFIQYILLASVVLSFTSCATKMMFDSKVPYYTSVENLLKLKPGMTFNSVKTTLGIDPYDVLTIQNDNGSTIYTYHYRLKDRKLTRPLNDFIKRDYEHTELFQKEGEPWYNLEEKIAYLYFKEGKYTSFISEEGLNLAEYVMLIDNNLRIISSEDLKKLQVTKIGNNYITSDSTYIIKMDKETKKNLNNLTPAKKKGSTKVIVATVLIYLLVIPSLVFLIVN